MNVANFQVIDKHVCFMAVGLHSSAKIQQCNDSLCQLLGYKREEMLTLNLQKLLPEPYCQMHNR